MIVKRTKWNSVPNRTVYRNYKKYGLMPARNMEIVDMLQWTMEAFDWTKLNSKFITKLLYCAENNKFEFGIGISEETYIKAMKQMNFCWRETSGPTMYERAVQFQLNFDNQADDPSPEGCLRLQRFLLQALIKEGGLIALSEKERRLRADAVGHIQKAEMANTDKKYHCWPCNEVPIHQCGFCNMYNIYSHADSIESPVHEQLWRCAGCWSDMRYACVRTREENTVDDLFGMTLDMTGIEGGHQLERLMLSNYGDVYEDLDTEARKHIHQSDISLVNKYFRNAYQAICEIGVNLSINDLDKLKAEHPRLVFTKSLKSTSAAGLADYELSALIVDVLPRTKMTNEWVVDGCHRELKPNKHIKYGSRPLFMLGDFELTNKEPDLVCITDARFDLNALSRINKMEIIIIVPILDNQHNLLSTQKIVGDIVYYQFGHTSQILSISKRTLNIIMNNDVLIGNNGFMLKTKLESNTNWVAFRLTKMSSKPNLDNWKSQNTKRVRYLTLNLPDFEAALSNPLAQMFKTQTIFFETDLFNILFIKHY
jgi:hypothetical protein